MKPQRRDASRRITPDLLDFYIRRAHALREEFFRDMGRAIVAWLVSRMGLALRETPHLCARGIDGFREELNPSYKATTHDPD